MLFRFFLTLSSFSFFPFSVHAALFAVDPTKRAALNELFYILNFPPPCPTMVENRKLTAEEYDALYPPDKYSPDCVPRLNEWLSTNAPCDYFGYQYSMEWFFGHVFDVNRQFLVKDVEREEAYFVFFPHCVSRIYFVFKMDFGLAHWDAIRKSEEEYLIPLLRWASNHPLHKKFNGKNFWTVFSMDLGRQDFQNSKEWLREWSVGQLAGHPEWSMRRYWPGVSWSGLGRKPWETGLGLPHSSAVKSRKYGTTLEKNLVGTAIDSRSIEEVEGGEIGGLGEFSAEEDSEDPQQQSPESPNTEENIEKEIHLAKTHPDSCWETDTKHVVEKNDVFTERVQYWYDTVISIPTRFSKSVRSLEGSNENRDIDLFFAGSPNSCARREAVRLLGHLSGTEKLDGSGEKRNYLVINSTLPAPKDENGEEIANKSSEIYEDIMHRSKFCLVMCGSSHTNNVRLTDVVVHGCVPVVVSDDIQPSLDGVLSWTEFAIFLPTYKIGEIPQILESISEEQRVQYFHKALVGTGLRRYEDLSISAADVLDWQTGIYFLAFFWDIKHISMVQINK